MTGTSETNGSAPPDVEGGTDANRASAPIDRSAALAEGSPGIPIKFVYWGLGVVLVLSLVA